mmetsp:Transcript_17287/g.49418  ORF Transcript_17287/g.49418 Transcript_17287/m.49418 type:complete len:138 (-) Transcript_17287:526-939(-)
MLMIMSPALPRGIALNTTTSNNNNIAQATQRARPTHIATSHNRLSFETKTTCRLFTTLSPRTPARRHSAKPARGAMRGTRNDPSCFLPLARCARSSPAPERADHRPTPQAKGRKSTPPRLSSRHRSQHTARKHSLTT